MRRFPFDYQAITLWLTSNWDVKHLQFYKDPDYDDNIRTWNFKGKQEWELQEHVLGKSTENFPEEAASQNFYPFYRVRLHVMRKYGFYFYNVALVMCLITALTFTSFAVDEGLIGDRLQITVTLLLTSIAFKYYVQSFVPTVSYLTLVDKYVLTCIVFQFGIAAIHNSLPGILPSKNGLHYFEWACFAVGLVIFLIIHIMFAIISVRYVKENERKKRKHEMAYKRENEATAGRAEAMKNRGHLLGQNQTCLACKNANINAY